MDRIVFNIVEKAAKNISDICVGPLVSDEELINCVKLEKSFGYDCSKLYNLAAIEDTVIYTSGNIIHFLNIKTGALKLQRSVRCTGIGHIAVNLVNKHIAIGEKGSRPGIYILSWPKLDVVSTLTNGTEKSYSFLDYSYEGKILCSVGGLPDNTLALWDWEKSTMLVKCEASNRPVFRAAFSKLQPEVVVTGGEGHIKFWRTSKTFTGLKLSGENGNFGSTPASDVIGFEFLDDGKVASGCDWGNILIWANNKLDVEVTTRRQITCHQTPAFSFHRHNSWLISIGTDGWVRVWDMGKIGARCEENDKSVCRQESLIYFTIGKGTKLLSKVDLPSAPNDLIWLLQDGLGAIWHVDVGPALVGHERVPSLCNKLLNCHSGKIIAMAVCPFGPFFATIGPNGRIMVHNYESGYICEKNYRLEATTLVWINSIISEQTNDTVMKLIIGFESGALSLCCVNLELHKINELQGIRPHKKPVKSIKINLSCNLVASASEDLTVFILKLVDDDTYLEPIGFISIGTDILCIDWNVLDNLLVCCKDCTIISYDVSGAMTLEKPRKSYKISLIPQRKLGQQELVFNLKFDGPFFKLIHCENWEDNEIVLFARVAENAVKVYIYDFNTNSGYEMANFTFKLQITSISISADKCSCLFGFATGEVQFSISGPANDATRQKWSKFWRLRMHESDRGSRVSAVGFSHDAAFFLTSGFDGSIFLYKITRQNKAQSISKSERPVAQKQPWCKIRGLPAKNCTKSLEEIRAQKAAKLYAKLVDENKENLLKALDELKIEFLDLKRNTVNSESFDMIKGHQLLKDYFAEKIIAQRRKMLSLIEPKAEFCRGEWSKIHSCFMEPIFMTSINVQGIREDCYVESYMIAKRQEMQPEEISASSSSATLLSVPSNSGNILRRKSEINVKFTSGLLEMDGVDISSFRQQRKSVSTANQVAEKLRSRQAKRNSDNQKLMELLKDRPKRSRKDLQLGESAMGVLKLKTDKEYCVPQEERVSSEHVLDIISSTKAKIFELQMQFNRKLIHLKRERKQLMNEILIDGAEDGIILEDKNPAEDYLYSLCSSKDLYENLSQSGSTTKTELEKFDLVVQFDSKVQSLIEERLRNDVSICLLKQWFFCVHQKLDIVLSMEQKELELKQIMREQQETRKALQENMDELRQSLDECKSEIARLESQVGKIELDLCAEIEGSLFFEHLFLLFKKDYVPPSLSIASSITDGSDEARSGTSSAGSMRHVSEKVCPVGCDSDLFDFVNQCRLLRYEIDIQLMERRRLLNLMLKDEDVLRKKLKLADKNIVCSLKEIDAFYRDRQTKINELEVAVPLKLHQIPAGEDFSCCVLISMQTLEKLARKSDELQEEAADLDLRFQTDSSYLKEIKSKITITKEELGSVSKCIEETMIQRFGKIINIAELESAILGCEIENFTKPKYAEVDEEDILQCKSYEEEIDTLETQILTDTEVKKVNSIILAKLLKELNKTYACLDTGKHKNCSREDAGERRAQIKRLAELVLAQREQISAIRYELELLRCKVASSRVLLGVEPDESADVPPPSEDHFKKRKTKRKPSRALSKSAPEILIEHCESENSDSADEQKITVSLIL